MSEDWVSKSCNLPELAPAYACVTEELSRAIPRESNILFIDSHEGRINSITWNGSRIGSAPKNLAERDMQSAGQTLSTDFYGY